ncbi:hypothetical protein SLEP1_g52144 [Rubroshorea leprosula]|uniref:GDSL esterase/lipase n=1 Tax=Rubroshorea leprosula TaxID=152421 RepID=A0AAV5M934_9ROSI|nr:hypothetical protein SLEP1_g52144 [Rubroshorea leprosula]
MVQLYNSELRNLLDELRTSLNGSVLIYADTYRIVNDILQNSKSYGFVNANSACCSLGGRHGGLVPCGPLSKVCPDRSKYVFWDAYHPSEAANIILAKRLMDGNSDYISAINIRQLAQL